MVTAQGVTFINPFFSYTREREVTEVTTLAVTDQTFKAEYRRRLGRALQGFLSDREQREHRTRWRAWRGAR